MSISDEIRKNYVEYLEEDKKTKILRKCLFNITVIIYALETQHYFHAISKGEKFKYILKDYKDFFDNLEKFAFNTKINISENNVLLSKWGLVGEADIIEDIKNKKIIWEIKCVSDISLKHIIQVAMYNIMYYDLDKVDISTTIEANFINFLKGDIINIKIPMTLEKINRIKEIFATTAKSSNA